MFTRVVFKNKNNEDRAKRDPSLVDNILLSTDAIVTKQSHSNTLFSIQINGYRFG